MTATETKTVYVVSRHGWNGANQSSRHYPQVVEVWRGEAADADDAVSKAAESVSVYNGQHLHAREASEVEAEELATERTIQTFFDDAGHNLFRVGTYRPNGGVATWQHHYETNPEVRTGWESATVEGGTLELFRHDGPVLDYASYTPIDPEDAEVEVLECFTGSDSRIDFRDLKDYAEWLGDTLGLEDDSEAYKRCLAYALRDVADQLEE